jgi:16S rRNA G966 N2-methylase RsmD
LCSRRRRRTTKTLHDRAYLLGEAKRRDVLRLAEVEQYGRDSFGDPDYVSIYGLKPADWYARGIRLLARTAVECTRDALADLMGRDVAAAAARAPAVSGSVVLDPFAGSCNTLYWLARHVGAIRAVGFELDDGVSAATACNLTVLGLDLALSQTGYDAGIRALQVGEDELLIVFVAPPWGDALDEAAGLDLRRTQPPVATIVDLVADVFSARKVLLATQVYESTVPASLDDIRSRCAWSALSLYDLDAPGRNHGLLLGSLGWTP